MPSPKVSCILSAYNEANNIKEVLNSIVTSQLIDEIIVVDDGSSDETVAVVKTFPSIKIIKHGQNLGKSAAVKSGLHQAKNEVIILLDSDIPNITSQNIQSLISPITGQQFDVSIALIGDAIHRLIKVDILSGIRCTKKSILVDFLNRYHPEGYEFEVLFNEYMLINKLTFCYADWTNSYFKYSTSKYGRLDGLKRILTKRIKIYKRIGFFNFYLQYLKMFVGKNKRAKILE